MTKLRTRLALWWHTLRCKWCASGPDRRNLCEVYTRILRDFARRVER